MRCTPKSLSLTKGIIMLLPQNLTTYLSLNLLLDSISNRFLSSSYCLVVTSDKPLDFSFNNSFIFLSSNEIQHQLFNVSEIGCSDFVVQMQQPKTFITALKKVCRNGNARRSDRKIIFILEDHNAVMNLLSFKDVEFFTNVLLIVIPSERINKCHNFDILTHKYVGPDDEIRRPIYLDEWNSCTYTFTKNANLFPNDGVSDLNGRTLKLACFTYTPYVILDIESNNAAPNGRDGTDIRTMEEFCRWINCTIKLVRDDINQWGEYFENGTGNGVFGNLLSERADIGAGGIGLWYGEYEHFDLSQSHVKSDVTCITPSPRLLPGWILPLLPFSPTMWLLIGISLLYASLALTFANRWSTNKVLLTVFGMIISQSQNIKNTWRIRSIAGWLLLIGVVLGNAYNSGLTSIITVPKYERSVDTIQDVVDRQLVWGGKHDAWIFAIASSTQPLTKQLVSLFKVLPSEELKKKSFTGDMAFGIEKLPSGYFAIGEYITAEATLDLMIMLEDFYIVYNVFLLPKSSPYTEKLNQLIGRLHESGLLLAWESQVVSNNLNFNIQQNVRLSRMPKEVNVRLIRSDHVSGIFLLYAAGVTTSTVILLIEIIITKINVASSIKHVTRLGEGN